MDYTFKDLHEAVKKCGEVLKKSVGYGITIQVYQQCTQVNISMDDHNLCNVIFTDTKNGHIGLVSVSRDGIADYDHTRWVTINSKIANGFMPGTWARAMYAIIKAFE